MFLKLNFHLPLSCFDLDLQEDMSLLLPGFHHSVIILYTMKDNLRGELHFSLAPLAAAPRHYLANPEKKKEKEEANKRCHHAAIAHLHPAHTPHHYYYPLAV